MNERVNREGDGVLGLVQVFEFAVSVCDCSGPAAALMMLVCCELTILTVL